RRRRLHPGGRQRRVPCSRSAHRRACDPRRCGGGYDPVSPAPEVSVQLVAKVLVVSDGVHEGTREDRAGPKVVQRLNEAGWAGRARGWSGDSAGGGGRCWTTG